VYNSFDSAQQCRGGDIVSAKKKASPRNLARQRVKELRLGEQIKTLRREKKLTLQDLAERTGLSKPLLSQVENGIVLPPLITLALISSGLKVDISFWFFSDDMKKGRRQKVKKRAEEAAEALAEVITLCTE
jgi:transcriptional regulator with XRE-family HTH domain